MIGGVPRIQVRDLHPVNTGGQRTALQGKVQEVLGNLTIFRKGILAAKLMPRLRSRDRLGALNVNDGEEKLRAGRHIADAIYGKSLRWQIISFPHLATQEPYVA